MGIAERKAASQFEETVYPKLQKEIRDAAHFEVPIEVDWNSLAVEGYEHLYAEAWTKVYFRPLIQAFQALATDALGQEMLRGALQRIVIRNVSGAYSGSSMVSLKDGVLTLDHQPVTNVDSVDERQEAIQNALEAAPEEPHATDPLAAFLSWNIKGVNATLEALTRMAWRQKAGIPLRLPRMTLMMRSGRSVGGLLREVLEDRQEGRVLLIHVPPESGSPSSEVVLVPVSTVEAIAVHDVSDFGSLRRDAPPTPSPLQLRRRLAALETRLRGQTETALTVALAPRSEPLTAPELRALGFLADRAHEVLEALGADKIGRAALREKVQRILLDVADRSDVKVADHTLTLSVGRRPVNWSTRSELEQALQSAL